MKKFRNTVLGLATVGALALAPVSLAYADEVVPPVQETIVETPAVETPAVPEEAAPAAEVVETTPEEAAVAEPLPEPEPATIQEAVTSSNERRVFTDEDFSLVLWGIESETDDHFDPDQQFIGRGELEDLIDVSATTPADLFALVGLDIADYCGEKIQGDIYADSVSFGPGSVLRWAGDGEIWPGGGSYKSSYSQVFTTPACEEPPVIEFCETEGFLPTATDLDPQGWVLKPNRGEFVDGGLYLFSTSDSSGWAYKLLGIPFSQVGDLSTVYSDKTDQYTFGVILTLDGPTPGHAFGAQQIHYDEDGRYWTDQEGILGNGAILKGGYWETYDLHADLINDVNIANIVLYVNAGHGGLVVHSQNHSCGTQPFDKVDIPTRDPKVVVFEGEWTGGEPTCDVEDTEQNEAIVTQERVVTTTRIPFLAIIVNGLYELVEDLEHAEVLSTVVETNVLTYQGDDCVTPTEEPTPPPTTNTPVTPSGDLAYTAVNTLNAAAFWAIVAAMIAGIALVVGASIKRRHQ